MQTRRYDPTQYERQHRRRQQQTLNSCPNCGDAHHLVLVTDGLECWSCDEFIPYARRRVVYVAETATE